MTLLALAQHTCGASFLEECSPITCLRERHHGGGSRAPQGRVRDHTAPTIACVSHRVPNPRVGGSRAIQYSRAPVSKISSSTQRHSARRGALPVAQQRYPRACVSHRVPNIPARSPQIRALDAHDLRRGLRGHRTNRALAWISRTRHARSPQRVAFSVDAVRPTLRL